jgi:hypothetical protein
MKKSLHKKFVISFFILFLIVQFYSLVETAFAQTVSDQVIVTLNVTAGITISDGAAVTMAPPISVGVNSSIGSSTWTVITNAALGYTLSVKSSTNPALMSGANSFANFTEAVAGTPETWVVPPGAKEFGYSAFGTDTVVGTWGTDTDCIAAAGVPSAALKYVGFLTTDKIIATRATVTPIAGIPTTICFAAEQDAIFAAAGTYTATITGTAVTL